MNKKKIIPYGKQNITEEDIVAVSKALVGDYLTQGPLIKEFEEHFYLLNLNSIGFNTSLISDLERLRGPVVFDGKVC